ncbi:MAG TPA: creatininase family protein [Bacteroidales bacterium]|nr:creatininase family protein [Bacteroidales bacterium]
MSAPFILSENTWKTVQEQQYDIAVLPWGATEAHNYHLPFGTDTIETEFIARMAAEKAWHKGARVVVLPAIPFGVNTSQLDIFMTINMNPSTQFRIIEDILVSLSNHNISKFIVFNGHGGNDFKSIIRELQPKFPEIFIAQLNWFEVVPLDKFFEEAGDHANEMETSVMMNVVPQLVLPLTEAGPGNSKKPRFAARKEGWVWFPRAWTKVTDDTGIGNPAKASAEKGEKYLEAITDKIADFINEMAVTGPDDIYE